MWEKFKHQFSKHPYIFGAVGVAVVIFIFYGGSKATNAGGTSTSAISAEESQAIADSAQANAQLTLAQDQVQTQIAATNASVAIDAQDDATSQAIYANQTAAAVTVNQANDTATLGLAQLGYAAQNQTEADVLQSQSDAEGFIEYLEKNFKVYPQDLQTVGLVTGSSPQAAPVTNTVVFGGGYNPGNPLNPVTHGDNGQQGGTGTVSNGSAGTGGASSGGDD